MKFNNSNISIGENVRIGKSVKIGDHAVIYDNVVIGDEAIICNNCVLGEPLNDYYQNDDYTNPPTVIGPNSLIRSHTIIYASNTIGDHFVTGHRATIRENCTFGHHCSVGTLCDIQGYSSFGNYCRLHSNVHIGQESKVGDFVFISPYVIFTNDPTPPSNILQGPTIGGFTQIAVAVVVCPGVKVGQNCLLGAHSLITKDVEDFSVIVGNPGRYHCDIRDIASREKTGKHYPWMYNYERGMPWAGIGYEVWLKSNLK
jgi:acetyltransferase-like isoleucine patch superfamily enzyme